MVALIRILLLGTCVLGITGSNLLGNGDFEAATLGTHWSKAGCSWAISTTEKHGGNQSVYINTRSNNWAGLAYFIGPPDVTSGKLYAFVGYIKLDNLATGHAYHEVLVKTRIKKLDGSTSYSNLSRHPRLRPGYWEEIGGDIKLPSNVEEVKIYIQIEEKEVNYYFDDGSLVELVPDPDWKSKAQSDIDTNRKVSLKINVRKNKAITSLKGFKIKVNQLRSQFGHGSALQAKLWTNASYSVFKEFVYNTLKPEWSVLINALKWKGMRWSENTLRFDEANATINELLDNGLSIRGHNVFWSVEKWVPDWVRSITDPAEMMTKIDGRINEVLSLTKSRLKHWDVNNENLHDDFYERTTGDINITMNMFRDIHSAEPEAELFLNDFGVVNQGRYTTALKNQAKSFVDSQVPIHGIGVQSHLGSTDVDMTQLKYRLDKVAEAGLPIWVTELSIAGSNFTAKAQALDDVMTMYFSHKQVAGVILWGFWGASLKWPDGTPTVVVNKAGEKYMDLVNKAWRSNWSRKLKSYRRKLFFKGDYSIIVTKNGVTLLTYDLNLVKDRKLTFKVKGTDENPSIAVTLK